MANGDSGTFGSRADMDKIARSQSAARRNKRMTPNLKNVSLIQRPKPKSKIGRAATQMFGGL